jgi:anti-sigma factor RsiW
MTPHIPTSRLALYARGDLGFWHREVVERHVNGCEECCRAVQEFVQIQESVLRVADSMPPALDGVAWQALASEMSANIRLGLAAGECVSPREPSLRPVFVSRPRLSLALAGLTVLAVLLAMEHPALRRAPVQVPVQAGIGLPTLEASGDAVMVRSGDRGLSVAAPAGISVIRTVSSHGAVRSRYVDDTGVTIVNVYAE